MYLNLTYGFVALIAFAIGACIMDWLYAKRFDWLKKQKPISGPVSYSLSAVSLHVEDWAELATGDSGWKEIEEAWLRKVQEIYGVFCKKQADYGPTNIAVGGAQGVVLRTGDKVSRLFELLGLTERENGGEPSNESVRDSMVDLADYGIIGMIVLDGDWPFVSPSDVWGRPAAVELLLEFVKDDERLTEMVVSRIIERDVAAAFAEDVGGEVVNDA